MEHHREEGLTMTESPHEGGRRIGDLPGPRDLGVGARLHTPFLTSS
jgi:hypothetical protein